MCRKEGGLLRLERTEMELTDSKTVRVIGEGTFSEVHIVQNVDTGRIYAVKALKREEMLKKDQLAHVRAGCDVLMELNSPWIVQLIHSFQGPTHLYPIVEFLAGSDSTTFSEDMARLRIAECILAIEAVRGFGFVRRGMKLDNTIVDDDGYFHWIL